MKIKNLFAFLLLAAFANTTKKVSYSDIALNLVQLSDDNITKDAKMKEINESFKESRNLLNSMIENNNNFCQRIQTEADKFQTEMNKRIEDAQTDVKSLQDANKENENTVSKNVLDQKEEVKKIQEARRNILDARKNMVAKENVISETLNVLARLKNLAQDELVGNSKLETQMGNYTIVNEHGVSFIQKSNMRQELRSLLKNSEVAGKSLISTLILLTSNDNGRYSDPKAVQKILETLDKIISRNQDRKLEVAKELEEETKDYREIMENSEKLLDTLKEENIKSTFDMTINNKLIGMYNNDIIYFQAALKRRADNTKFRNGVCEKQKKIAETNNWKGDFIHFNDSE
jgi:TolA-binding protein